MKSDIVNNLLKQLILEARRILQKIIKSRYITNSYKDRINRYIRSLIYYELLNYIRDNKEAMKAMKLTRNRRRYLRYIAKFYIIFTYIYEI